jgi:hypothetical protein
MADSDDKKVIEQPDGQNPQQQINIELGEKEAEGVYSNLAIISHSPAEFVLDFTRILPGVPRARVLSRIIMTPQHARMLLNALEDNINRYEAQYGEIKVNQSGPQFGGFHGPDIGDKIH